MMFSQARFRQCAADLERAILELSREYQMGIKLQGIAAKVAKLQHDAEFEAEKLDAKVEEVAARMPTAFSRAHQSVDGLAKDVGEVEALVAGVEAIGNGAPPLEETKPEAKPETGEAFQVPADTLVSLRPTGT